MRHPRIVRGGSRCCAIVVKYVRAGTRGAHFDGLCVLFDRLFKLALLQKAVALVFERDSLFLVRSTFRCRGLWCSCAADLLSPALFSLSATSSLACV